MPSPLLDLVLRDYAAVLSAASAAAADAAEAAATASAAATAAAQATPSPSPARAAAAAPRGLRRGKGRTAAAAAAASPTILPSTLAALPAPAATPSGPHGPHGVLYLDGRPRLGLRYQRMEAPALRRAFGLEGAHPGGVLVTGVDPTGSAAGLVQVRACVGVWGGAGSGGGGRARAVLYLESETP